MTIDEILARLSRDYDRKEVNDLRPLLMTKGFDKQQKLKELELEYLGWLDVEPVNEWSVHMCHLLAEVHMLVSLYL